MMFPGVCAFLTWGVLKWQLGGCSFYVNPIYSGPSRTFAVVGYLAMHLGFACKFLCCNIILIETNSFYFFVSSLLEIGNFFLD